MEQKYRTGLERFYDKYPNYQRPDREEDYLGIGAMCDTGLIERLTSKNKEQQV